MATYVWDRYSCNTSWQVTWLEYDRDRENVDSDEYITFYSSYSIDSSGRAIGSGTTKKLSGYQINEDVVGYYFDLPGTSFRKVMDVSTGGNYCYVYYVGTSKITASYSKGSYIDKVTSSNSSSYPQDGVYNGGYWYVYRGQAIPSTPSSITPPSKIKGDQSNVIQWGASTILYGSITYELECQWDNSGSWTQIYKGTGRSYSHFISNGTYKTVKYRVRAYGESVYSDYATSASQSIINNAAPNAPSGITTPDTIRGGADAKISWPASTDPDGNLDGYIVERSYNDGSSWAQIYQGRSTSTTTTIPFGTETVMFRVCAYDTYGDKSGWRTSANKTVVNNRAPTAPPSISVPLSPAGGDKLTITWTASTDADGNLEGYELERQWDGAGAFTQIYKGAGLSYQDSIPKGEHTSVVYRVRAYDSFAAYSSYTTSPSRTIDNNTAPVIECSQSGDLGEKSEGFSIQYTIRDAEKQEVTVAEKVGDLVKRTYKATLDSPNTFEVTGEYFQKILNGAQTVQIVATDSAGKSSTLSLTFTKAVHKTVITLSEPLAVEEQITVAVLAITGKIPADATQLIELTNNGNDPEPVWEDATADVKAGRNYVFKNKSQSAGWAFNFRVTVERGESGEDGNIVSIQGGFQ